MKNDASGRFAGLLRQLKDLSLDILNKISKLFDKTVYNRRASLIVTFVLSLLICVSISFEDLSFQFFRTDDTTLNLTGITVDALYDSQKYEVTGLPNTADVAVTGDSADIQMLRTQNSVGVKADLRSLEPGDNMVTLQATGVPSNLSSTVTPESVRITLERKETRTFIVSPELLLGTGQSSSLFRTPVLETSSVSVQGTSEKLNSIRTVKAIVDASGHSSGFSADAVLVAYDASGKQVNVTIIPETVKATVALRDSGSSSDSDSDSKKNAE